jgi:hypothetical protein
MPFPQRVYGVFISFQRSLLQHPFDLLSPLGGVPPRLLLQLATFQAVFDVLLDGSILVSHLLSYCLSVPLSSPPDLFDPLLCRQILG